MIRFVTQFTMHERSEPKREAMTDRQTDLYRHFNKDGDLLYVGISFRAIIRQSAHANAAPWWNEVTTITVERLPNREKALVAEKAAVENENPRYNKHWGKKPFRYKTQRKHGLSIDLPGAPEMADAVMDWYLCLTRNRIMPKALRGLAEKFDQSTDAGRAYAITLRALASLHMASKAEAKAQPNPERTIAGMEAAKARGWKPGPPTLVDRLKAKDPKRLAELLADIQDPMQSWRKLQKKYGYSVATLRRHFEELRKSALDELAAEDESK